MHYMCLEVVDKVIRDPVLLRLFRIPSDLWPAVRRSWGLEPYVDRVDGRDYYTYKDSLKYKKQMDFLGRFDWSWDGKKLKLLEYNADTPSLLLESGAVSKQWFGDKAKGQRRLLEAGTPKLEKVLSTDW